MGASLMPLNVIIRACTSNFNTRSQVDDVSLNYFVNLFFINFRLNDL